MHNLSVIRRKYQTNQNGGIFYKLTQYSSKVMVMKNKGQVEELSQISIRQLKKMWALGLDLGIEKILVGKLVKFEKSIV